MKKILGLSLLLCLATSCVAQTTTPAEPEGTTKVARWQDDKKGTFLLMYDDGWPSGFQVAVPEMKKRGLIGTFYICPAKGEYVKFEKIWLKDVLEAGMVLGNHTMTHNGFQGAEDTEMEVTKANEYLLKNVPGKNPRLISWAMPGVSDHNYGDVPLEDYLKKNNLIARGTFRDHGANYHVKTVEQMMKLADKAIETGGVEYLVFHGLERTVPNWSYQDMWAVKQDIFFPFLDGLKERQDRGDLWITDHISSYKYETERNAATVNVLEKSAKKIRVELKCTTDPQFFDQPLTLITSVPAKWSQVKVTQAGTETTVAAKGGKVMYNALPGEVTLQPA